MRNPPRPRPHSVSERPPASHPPHPTLPLSRRGVLAVTGGLAAQLVACRADLNAPPAPGSIEPGGFIGGTGGGGAGSGGRSGSGGNGSGGSAASGGAGGTAGGPGSGASGSDGGDPRDSGVDGRAPLADGGPAGEPDGAFDGAAPGTADGGADFADDARIEVGGAPGTDGGANATCVVTRDDELGPYYLSGTPERTVMAGPGDGQMLVVTGRVLDTRCRPLAGAVLDVWSTNNLGQYSQAAQGFGRGKVRADGDGFYQFDTVVPGAYLGRPRHVHFIVNQPGHARLTTQMYFKGERPDIDALAVTRTLVGGVWQCHFDIVLAGGLARITPPGKARPPIASRSPIPRRRFWSVLLGATRPV